MLTFVFSTTVNSATLNESLALLGKRHSVIGKTDLDKNSVIKRDKKTYDTLFFNIKNVKYQLEVVAPSTESEFKGNQKNFAALALKKYEDEPMPYQGEITNVSICPKKFIPVILQEKAGKRDVFIVKYFTGSTYSHRICEDKLIAFSTCTSFYFDQKKLQNFKLTVSAPTPEDCVSPVLNFFSDLVNF